MDKYELLEKSEFWKYLVGYMGKEAIIKLPKVPLALAFKHNQDKLIEFIDKKLIMIPNYCNGENHLQYLQRYKIWLKQRITQGNFSQKNIN